jgi:hypothetical protein
MVKKKGGAGRGAMKHGVGFFLERGAAFPSRHPPSSLTLVHDGLDDHGVLQDVLAPRLEELDACIVFCV